MTFRVYDSKIKAVYNTEHPVEGEQVLDGATTHDVYGNPLPPEYGVASKPKTKTEETK